ncbi:preprotein translocase subunit SecG [Porphyromonas pogonae]|uniref:preprotein translocase subunit SecG n=1 Tax=Porphyromonas pogonae TaxID=867595 RepID=UPI002E77D2C1|nr:preprotein translocase subunit SecG [Porphyromonas pogonae]
MYIFLTILILLASVLLILVVMVQNSKGGGLAAGFASSNQIMGVRKTTDFLEKATWWLVGLVVVLSILSARYLHASKETQESKYQQAIEKKAVLPTQAPAATPNFGNEAAPATTAPATPQTATETKAPADSAR